jgi:hypothetical protein
MKLVCFGVLVNFHGTSVSGSAHGRPWKEAVLISLAKAPGVRFGRETDIPGACGSSPSLPHKQLSRNGFRIECL